MSVCVRIVDVLLVHWVQHCGLTLQGEFCQEAAVFLPHSIGDLIIAFAPPRV